VNSICVENAFDRRIRLQARQYNSRNGNVIQFPTQYASRGDRACIPRDIINRLGFERERIECYYNFVDEPSRNVGCGFKYFLKKNSDLIALHVLQSPSGGFNIRSEPRVASPPARRVRTVCIENDRSSSIRLVLMQNTSTGSWQNVSRYVKLGLRSCLEPAALASAVDGFPVQCQYNSIGFENYVNDCRGDNFILDRSSNSLGVYECSTLTCRGYTR